MGYINGTARRQKVMFPQTLDEYVEENNAVRAIDAFIEYLPFDELGFVRGEPAETGRPGYDPRVLLGIFIWGHLNGVRSSRRLERECGRNVELMWLSGQLQPDFKTLCRFRQENGAAINQVLVQFRVWCNGAELFGKELVAIDGSKFKAVNSTARNVTQGRLAKLIEREKQSVTRYLQELAAADEQEGDEPERTLTVAELKQKIATIGDYLKQHEELLGELKESGEKQRSLTDPEARLMKTAKGMDVCYNVQTAVDSKHKLIVAVAVTNEVTDQELLAEMAQQAKAGLAVEELTVVADGGYFGCEVIKACEDERITAYVPVPELGDAKRRGLFTREQFEYDESRDTYVCPAKAELTVMSRTMRKARHNKEFRVYATKQCQGCPLRAQCTTSKYGRRIKRWVHQEVLTRLQARLRAHPEMLQRRKALVEHPFGTIKVAMNHERLLLKGLKHVATEIKLTVLSYNLKRVMSILSVATMIEKLKPQTV
ncbi:MAG: IS1182 family transposase [Pyrinomonadaceae bacterium]